MIFTFQSFEKDWTYWVSTENCHPFISSLDYRLLCSNLNISYFKNCTFWIWGRRKASYKKGPKAPVVDFDSDALMF